MLKRLWSEQEWIGRLLMVALAFVLVGAPVGVVWFVRQANAAGRDSPLDFVTAGHRTAIAEYATADAAWWDEMTAATATRVAYAAPTPVSPVTPGPGSKVRQPTLAATATPIGLAATPTRAPDGSMVADYAPTDGAATLIQAPGGTILVDAGSAAGGYDLLEFILEQGVTSLDLLILTSYDDAYAGGLEQVLALVPPDSCLVPESTDEANSALQAIDAASIPRSIFEPDATLELGALRVSCLVSTPATAYADGELAVRVDYGAMGMLFYGGSTAEALLANLSGQQTAEAWRVPVGGPARATALKLARTFRPEFVIQPGGWPDGEALLALTDIGLPVYTTEVYGGISFQTDGYAYELLADRLPTPTPNPGRKSGG